MSLKSLRLDDDLARRLRTAARERQVTESAFIRDAISDAIARAEPVSLRTVLADAIGSVAGGALGDSRYAHDAVADDVVARTAQRRSG